MKRYKVRARFSPPTDELERGEEIVELPDDWCYEDVEDFIRDYILDFLDWSYEEI